jgi:hypothetical protein
MGVSNMTKLVHTPLPTDPTPSTGAGGTADHPADNPADTWAGVGALGVAPTVKDGDTPGPVNSDGTEPADTWAGVGPRGEPGDSEHPDKKPS